MMPNKALLMISLVTFTAPAMAQNCAAGIPSAGNPGCIPPDRENSPYYQGSYGQAQPSVPRAVWKLTWGGIATDGTTGDTGVSVGLFSKREAVHEALLRCMTWGANHCKIALVYYNQCAVIADPKENGKNVDGTSIIRGGPTIEDASKGALASCAAARRGGLCKIVYSACTKPVLVQ